MDVLSFYIKIYEHLSCNFLPYWFLTPVRRVIRKLANIHLSKYLNRPYKQVSNREEKLIVSFTSFPTRINNVWKIVECIKRQTIVPRKIILWLSEEQFPTKESLPCSIQERIDDVFEVRFVEGDIRSHKKYLYVCQEYPNDMVFLIDDDIFYSPELIEKSLETFKEHPNCVICNYGSGITFDDEGHHLPYNDWKSIGKDENIFFGSGGGTLFVPSSLYKDLTKIDLALWLAPTADDVWLNAMARLAGVRVVLASNNLMLPVVSSNNVFLSSINNGESQNDIQIAAIENYYGKCFDFNYKRG